MIFFCLFVLFVVVVVVFFEQGWLKDVQQYFDLETRYLDNILIDAPCIENAGIIFQVIFIFRSEYVYVHSAWNVAFFLYGFTL